MHFVRRVFVSAEEELHFVVAFHEERELPVVRRHDETTVPGREMKTPASKDKI